MEFLTQHIVKTIGQGVVRIIHFQIYFEMITNDSLNKQ